MLAHRAMDQFNGRVAVITGGAGGIGMAMARAFASGGAKLVLADLDEAALQRVAGGAGGRRARRCSASAPTSPAWRACRRSRTAARKRFGAVHIICNNAGVAPFGEMHHASHRDWVFTMNVNFWGVVHGVETFVPLLIEQGQGGHIINTASMAGLVGMRWLGIYCASKFAVVGADREHARASCRRIRSASACSAR